jgi:hypothetical protein
LLFVVVFVFSQFSRVFFAIAAGLACGILNCTGFLGLLFYVSFEIFFCFGYNLLIGGQTERFFVHWSAFVFANLFQSFMV